MARVTYLVWGGCELRHSTNDFLVTEFCNVNMVGIIFFQNSLYVANFRSARNVISE